MRVLIPAKASHRAKGRLSETLSAAERTALMLALLENCLARVTEAARMLGAAVTVVVVTRDRPARNLAGRYGAEVAPDDGDGPNPALEAAVGAVREPGPVCILAADLPLLDAHSVSALWAEAGPGRLVLAPDRLGNGTNALVLPSPDAAFPLFFGPNSRVRHTAAADARGWETREVRYPGLGVDLDEPWDLDLIRGLCSGRGGPIESLARVPLATPWRP